MPNGRTGGFKMLRAELEILLGGFDQHVEIGRSLAAVRNALSFSAPPVNLTVAGALAILRESRLREISIEEHDYEAYLVQFEPNLDPDKWVVVVTTSPLFTPLRERHRRVTSGESR
jgi:hypothetical protein